jgi:hypothetical protein
MELDTADLKVLTPRVHKVEEKITALAYPLHSLLLIGDAGGAVQALGGKPAIVEPGAPIVALIWRGEELWVAAGRTIAQFTMQGSDLKLQSSFPNLPAPVVMLAEVGPNTYAAMGNRIQRITLQGAVGETFASSQSFVASAPGGHQVAVTVPEGLAFLHPESLKRTGAASVAGIGTVSSTTMTGGGSRLLIGTSNGEILEVTAR